MQNKSLVYFFGGAILIVAILGVNIDKVIPLVFQLAMPTDYFEPERYRPDEFVEVTDDVYAFRHGFNRSLIIDTGEKLAVIDTFNSTHSKALREILQVRFPGKQVGWVFYSHHHLDHIRGAANLAPQSVVAHKDVASYVADFDYVDDIAPVTAPVEDDTQLLVGNKTLNLLYLPRSHSETLYAFHLPDQKVLFLPDLMFKNAMPPFGFPDWYYPGYIRALDRLLAVEAIHHVPSHFDIGAREDLQSYRDMMVDFRQAVLAELAQHDYDAADGSRLREVLKRVYPKLKKEHGHRIGFNAMFIAHFGGQAAGTYLGF